MKKQENANPWGFVLAFVGIAFVVHRAGQTPPAPDVVNPPDAVEGFFSDVRLKLPAEVHEVLSGFIKTGKFTSGKVGIDTTQVKRILWAPGVLEFEPALRVTYDGPGPLNAATTVKEIRTQANGEILIDVVNSPIDVVIDPE